MPPAIFTRDYGGLDVERPTSASTNSPVLALDNEAGREAGNKTTLGAKDS